MPCRGLFVNMTYYFFHFSQVVLVFTRVPMDVKAVKKRLRASGGKSDDELGEI